MRLNQIFLGTTKFGGTAPECAPHGYGPAIDLL